MPSFSLPFLICLSTSGFLSVWKIAAVGLSNSMSLCVRVRISQFPIWKSIKMQPLSLGKLFIKLPLLMVICFFSLEIGIVPVFTELMRLAKERRNTSLAKLACSVS